MPPFAHLLRAIKQDACFPGDADVRQTVTTIRGHLNIQEKIVATRLKSIYGQTDIRQPVANLFRRQLRASQFPQPFVRNEHGLISPIRPIGPICRVGQMGHLDEWDLAKLL